MSAAGVGPSDMGRPLSAKHSERPVKGLTELHRRPLASWRTGHDEPGARRQAAVGDPVPK
jgi:hypothetical protein